MQITKNKSDIFNKIKFMTKKKKKKELPHVFSH